MKEIILIIVVGLCLYWFFILRPGRLDFWKLAAKYPDAAYPHFKSDPCWIVFEDDLPDNYRSVVPKSEWVGPFRLVVPMLGGSLIYVFGKYPTFEQSQDQFLGKFAQSR